MIAKAADGKYPADGHSLVYPVPFACVCAEEISASKTREAGPVIELVLGKDFDVSRSDYAPDAFVMLHKPPLEKGWVLSITKTPPSGCTNQI
jgi:hypothetical protein